MNQCIKLAVVAGIAAACASGPVCAQSIVDLGFLPGGLTIAPAAVSADGTTVVGSGDFNGFSHAFRWTAGGGIVNLGTLPDQLASAATAVTADGSLAIGQSGFAITKWAGAGTQVLVPWQGGVDQYAYIAAGITADGAVAIGNMTCAGVSGGDPSCDVYGYAFRADASGTKTPLLTVLPPPFYSLQNLRANGISGDGSVVVGTCPALDATTDGTRAFRWTQDGGLENLGIVPGFQPASVGQSHSSALAVSGDGSTIVGECDGQPISGSFTQRAFRWTAAGGMQDLGVLPGTFTTVTALAVNENGSAVVGKIANFNLFNQRALLWTPALGLVDLNSYLPTVGVSLSGWTLQSAVAISADGRVIVGTGSHAGGTHGWVVTLPPATSCYANCDASATAPVLNVGDFTCFLQKYASGDSYANCDGSTAAPVLNVGDFTCFLQKYAAGCP